MAKIYGLFGSLTGKLADTVMAVRNGEQLARKYQPVVFNPSTPAQVAQRAKLKLLSQLSAVMAPVIAIPRVGSVSSRNLFTKKNFPNVTYATDEASVNLVNVQITNSVVGIPSVVATRLEENIFASLTSQDVDVDRVVYAIFEKRADKSIRLLGTSVATTAGTQASPWGASLPLTTNEVVVLAYGVRDNTENARAKFSNLEAVTGENVASLLVSRALTETDVTLTETVGVQLAATSQANMNPDDGNRTTKKK